MKSITIIKPDDWHLHFRDTVYLPRTVQDTAKQFGRAIVMPNLIPPVRTVKDAHAYFLRIKQQLHQFPDFQPLMTLYLTDNTTSEDIIEAAQSDFVFAAKLYPAGATTNSEFGVTHLKHLHSVFETMQHLKFPLLIHGEVTSPKIDIFDREAIFIESTLQPLRNLFPELKIVLEHITTQQAVDYITESDQFIAATITPHHLLINRNALFQGGIRPHHYCLPVVKREAHRIVLNQAAISGNKKFFAGTDSAPHAKNKKESSCGCAGIYSSSHAVELYAEAFERNQDFTHFESFMSKNGANFYNLPLNKSSITLIKQPWTVSNSLEYGEKNNEKLIPFMAGETLQWSLQYD